MSIDYNSDFPRELVNRFIAAQNPGIKTLLHLAEIHFSANEPAFIVEYPEDHKPYALALIKQRMAIVHIDDANFVPITIRVGEEGSTLMPEVNVQANPLTETEAINRVKELDRKNIPAAITYFSTVRTQGMSLYMNNSIQEFTGYSTQELANDESIGLFVRTEAMQSLNDLQEQLRAKGSVTDFPLISGRTNGQFGTYTIDAFYVDWGGLEARLTVYKKFIPAVVQSH